LDSLSEEDGSFQDEETPLVVSTTPFTPINFDNLPKVVSDFTQEHTKRKEFMNLGKRQRNRRIKEFFELVEWSSNHLKISEEEMNEILKLKLMKKHSYALTQMEQIPVKQALFLKDDMLMSDWSYQKLRNAVQSFVPLEAIKKERKRLNEFIGNTLCVKTAEKGTIEANPRKVLELLQEIFKTNTFKITFDQRKNEGRKEVILAVIPSCHFIHTSHSPKLVYPLLLYVGEEEEIKTKGDEIFKIINQMIHQGQISLMISTDLKSFWEMTGGRFKFAKDVFCPYCNIKKGEIEELKNFLNW